MLNEKVLRPDQSISFEVDFSLSEVGTFDDSDSVKRNRSSSFESVHTMTAEEDSFNVLVTKSDSMSSLDDEFLLDELDSFDDSMPFEPDRSSSFDADLIPIGSHTTGSVPILKPDQSVPFEVDFALDDVSASVVSRVLVVPFAGIVEARESVARTVLLAHEFRSRGIEVAVCMAHDENYRRIGGVYEFPLDTPTPLGLPQSVAKRTLPLAQKSGFSSRKLVSSFEEVLHLTGNVSERYFRRAVGQIREAILKFQPDVVYSDFNIAAIVAARREGVRICATASVPTRFEFANSPEYSKGIRRVLSELGLPAVRSALNVLDWPHQKFIPSSPELEPFGQCDGIYCGFWGKAPQVSFGPEVRRDIIVVYMGSSMNQRTLVSEMNHVFAGTGYRVYIAGVDGNEGTQGSVYTAKEFNFAQLLPRAALFINHGGQGSVMEGLIHGVPQLICPGKMFERQYNAQCISRSGAGIELPTTSFTVSEIRRCAGLLICDSSYRDAATRIGEKLIELGGVSAICDHIMYGHD